jgi:hypothetical protein
VIEDQKVIKIETLAFQSHMGHLVYHLSEQILFRHLPGPTTKGVRKKVLDENIVIYLKHVYSVTDDKGGIYFTGQNDSAKLV